MAAIATIDASEVHALQFQLSSKFREARFLEKQQLWDGQYRFGNILCLKFPRANDAESLAEAMYNKTTTRFTSAVPRTTI